LNCWFNEYIIVYTYWHIFFCETEEETKRIADEVNRIKHIAEEKANAQHLLELANKLKSETERVSREEAKRIQDDINKKFVNPIIDVKDKIDYGVNKIKDIPTLVTKELPKVLLPVAFDLLKKVMPKPKGGNETESENGYYKDADGVMWVKDETGLHKYIPDDPVYSQDASGVWFLLLLAIVSFIISISAHSSEYESNIQFAGIISL
jgi:hypothetical protein